VWLPVLFRFTALVLFMTLSSLHVWSRQGYGTSKSTI